MGDVDRVRHDPPRLASVGDLELCYDSFGDPELPTMLLIMGLGFQLSTGRTISARSSPPKVSGDP